MDDIEQKLASLKVSDSAVICIVCAAWWSDSIESAKTKWLKFAEQHAPSIPIMVIINSKEPSSSDPTGERDVLQEFVGIDEAHKVRVPLPLSVLITCASPLAFPSVHCTEQVPLYCLPQFQSTLLSV